MFSFPLMTRLAATGVLLLCSACSNAPSGREIEAAAQGLLSGQCKPARVESVKLVNGLAESEQRYRAKVAFEVVIPADTRVGELWAGIKDVEAQIKERDDRFAHDYKVMEDELGATLRTMTQRLDALYDKAERDGDRSASREDALHKERDEVLAFSRDKDAKLKALSEEHDREARLLREQVKGHDEIKERIIASGCLGMTIAGTERELLEQTLRSKAEKRYEAPRAVYRAFAEGVRQPFEMEMMLVKTDKGWRTAL